MSVALLVLAAAQATAPPRFELSAAPFDGGPPEAGAPFTAAGCDFDRDGDPDLLINRHNLAPLELWRNDGGTFTHVDRAEAGLDEQPGIGTLYADPEAMTERIAAVDGDGLFVWHGPKRHGAWQFVLRRAAADEPLALEILTNREIKSVKGLGKAAVRRPDPMSAVLSIDAGQTVAEFTIRIHGISNQLVGRWSDAGPPFYVGADLLRVEAIDVWAPDPHGVAWVDVEGSPEPELYVGRGALAGTLRREQRPKTNRYFTWHGDDRCYELRAESPFPAEWGRARQVQWVDVDRDGRLELYVGNRTGPNALFVRNAESGRFEDRAAELAIDPAHGDSFAWLDIDRDGWLDLLHLEQGDRIRGLRNVEGRRFERLALVDFGLKPPDGPKSRRGEQLGEYFETLEFHVADFDSDGRLDLLLTGHRANGRAHLFLARENGFEDVTESAGLAELDGLRAAFLIDADNDGFEDVIGLRKADVLLLHNRGGSFARVPVSASWERGQFGTGCALDADGDGLEDFALVSGPRRFALNRTATENRALIVAFAGRSGDAIGTVVTAVHASGREHAARLGAQRNPPRSQTADGLRFGFPPDDPIRTLRVARDGEVSVVDVEPGSTRVEIPR